MNEIAAPAGQEEAASAEPDAEPRLTRQGYRLAAHAWRRKEPTEVFPTRGRCDLALLDLGLVFRSVSLRVRHDGAVHVAMPTRVTPSGRDDARAVDFRDSRARNIFARRVLQAVRYVFPDFETCEIGITHFRQDH